MIIIIIIITIIIRKITEQVDKSNAKGHIQYTKLVSLSQTSMYHDFSCIEC